MTAVAVLVTITMLQSADFLSVVIGLTALSVIAYSVRERAKPKRQTRQNFGGAERKPVLPNTEPEAEEAISNYLGEPQPLTEDWFADYVRTTDDYPETLSLVVTERPIGFAVECHHTITERVSIRRVRDHTGDFLYRQVVIADLSGLMDEAEQKRVLSAARDSLTQCVNYKIQQQERLREKYRKQNSEQA